jgi:uncharacterized short protein YbdD (DUF466 family)
MGRAAELTRQIRWTFSKMSWALSNMSWYWSSLMGDNHYRRYVDFCARTHPGEPVMSERDYWRMRHAVTEADPQTRCC